MLLQYLLRLLLSGILESNQLDVYLEGKGGQRRKLTMSLNFSAAGVSIFPYFLDCLHLRGDLDAFLRGKSRKLNQKWRRGRLK